MEQTRAYFPAAACLRFHDFIVKFLQGLCSICDILPERIGTRARHGSRNKEDKVALRFYDFLLLRTNPP
jgi:hypothetical protein